MRKILFLNGFWLKIIALITMTIDHVGFMIDEMLPASSPAHAVVFPFRVIGRIAFPLYIFLAVEGALNTKHIWKYILRLGILASAILIFQIVAHFGFREVFYQGSIFIELLLVVLVVHLLESKAIWKKLLAIIPIAFCVVTFFLYAQEDGGKTFVWYIPYFIRPQYSFLGMLMGLGFYLGYKIVPAIYENNGMKAEFYNQTDSYRFYCNLCMVLSVVVASLVYHSISFIAPDLVHWNPKIQFWSILAALPLLFYNGNRGYYNKFVKYGFYLYYPVHLIIIYAIFLLI